MTVSEPMDGHREDVRALIEFVEARTQEDWILAQVSGFPDGSLIDVCEMAERMLARARDCPRDEPCMVSRRCVAVLVEVA